jgi:hypothetical protein
MQNGNKRINRWQRTPFVIIHNGISKKEKKRKEKNTSSIALGITTDKVWCAKLYGRLTIIQ